MGKWVHFGAELGQTYQFSREMLPSIKMIPKLNFLQNPHLTYESNSPSSGARG